VQAASKLHASLLLPWQVRLQVGAGQDLDCGASDWLPGERFGVAALALAQEDVGEG
jgi:hypothetical protein